MKYEMHSSAFHVNSSTNHEIDRDDNTISIEALPWKLNAQEVQNSHRNDRTESFGNELL